MLQIAKGTQETTEKIEAIVNTLKASIGKEHGYGVTEQEREGQAADVASLDASNEQ
ncbi:hypothetical protein HBI56_069550 [Parastagonospora nodorum]|nr:hypothetical protein HBH56_003990 [Parastagonospora nodorum]KAH3937940.1 hypothetical protein HBH54_003980 [Parastagonospora nodorum]KAH3975115.1 hypothetical protein HBH51_086740 [Parastagonospora nodorum]KAH4053015.1 hypothetical protein HBH49_093780 [Parastagonospora nodorum]KAH4122042.1 hypothetical protein HBH47_089600 [Parastagonospora nodorum]